MITFAGFLAAFITILAGGFGLTIMLVRRRLTKTEHFALAWLFGTVLVSLTLWLGGFVLRGIALQVFVAAICVTLGAIGFRRWRTFQAIAASRTRFENIFIAVFVIELMSILYLSIQHTLGWDGLTVWEMKARYAFLHGGALPFDYFRDKSRWFSHPEYPLLLPLTESWFYTWFGEADQFWIKLIFPIWYVAAMSILLLAAEELSGNRAIAWIIVLLFPLVPAINGAPGGVAVGYADVPIAAIFIAAIFYLLRFLRDDSRDALALFLALAATLPWMKREGAILWFVLTIAAVAILWSRRKGNMSILAFVPGICVIAAWKIFLVSVHALPSRDFAMHADISRVPGILHELWLTVIDRDLWNIFWLLAAFAIVAVVIRECARTTAVLLWTLFAPLALYLSSYIFSAWPDYIAHIDTSLPRLLIQLTPIAWLLIAFALRSTRLRSATPRRAITLPRAPLAPPPVSQSEL
jgi:hypothetical protein